MTLFDVQENTDFIIRKIRGAGTVRRRLLDIGLAPGARARLVRIAPFKSAYLIELRGFSIALKCDAARLVDVVMGGRA
jgi:Fe2+ transport system protein FeoA